MTADIVTVAWKEKKGLLRPRGSRRTGATMFIAPVMLIILLPLQIGEAYLDTPFALIMTFIVPMAIMLVSIPDSFAGERERHTLETLLASRLPDRAILYGKLIVPVMFTWAVLAVSHVTALIIFNAAHWDGGFRVHPPVLMVSIVGFGLLLPLLAGTIGVMISLRAATVQEAAQSLAMAVFSPLVALQIGGAVAFGMGRDRIEDIVETLKAANWTIIVVLVLAGLAAVTFLMLTAVAARFKRSRLIAG